MGLRYVVITSVDRDDLKDGGAGHFASCIQESRKLPPTLTIEVLVPDFRGRMDPALTIFKDNPPDVCNHIPETIPRLYKKSSPGSDSTEQRREGKESSNQWRNRRSQYD